MTDAPAVSAATAAQLLETLRQAIDRPDLALAAPPTALTGGFYAEMLRFRLIDPPPALDRDLVARIVPHPAAGAWEATIQGQVASQGFPTPVVRLTVPETGPLGRYLIVMDHIDGRPPMAGLSAATMVGQVPRLVRRLPEQLARLAVDLHALDAVPLVRDLAALESTIPSTTAAFVAEQASAALSFGRRDLADAGEELVATEPTPTAQVITHGDLHPFNVLVGRRGPALVDWTVARVADPGFTLGFAHLMLAHPPIPLPRPGTLVLKPVARRMAARFLATYRRLTDGTPSAIDAASLDWHRKVHAFRILVELATWDAQGVRPTSHPWLVLEPVARGALDLGP